MRPTHPSFSKLFNVALILAVLLGAAFTSTSSQKPGTVRLIVKTAKGLSRAQQQQALTGHGGNVKTSISPLDLHVVEVPQQAASAVAKQLEGVPGIVRVETDHQRRWQSAPSDTSYSSQWALPKIGWDQVYGSVETHALTSVAVLDTGVDASHPDLVGSLVTGTSIIDDSNGATDGNGHGTWVAGIIAAQTNNAEGIAGVGYSQVQVMPVKVLDENGYGQDSDIIEGLTWAADHGASVILMAFSNPGFSPALQEAVDYAWSKGAVLVGAVGNEGADAPTFPAGDAGVVGVSATDQNDALWDTSNYGEGVFLGAPGVGIVSTYKNGGYTNWNGTSASAAIVAGSAALMRAVDPTLSNGVVVGRLARTADAAGTQAQTGNGRVNLARAIADTSTDEIKPAGADPANGGPFVGPYEIAGAVKMTIYPNTGTSTPTITATMKLTAYNDPNANEAAIACTSSYPGSAQPDQALDNSKTPNSIGLGNNTYVLLEAAATASDGSAFKSWQNTTGAVFGPNLSVPKGANFACVENVKSGSQTWIVNYGGPTKLVFTTPAVNDIVNTCHLVTVQTQDPSGAMKSPNTNQPVDLTSSSGTPHFFPTSNGGCTGTGYITQVNILAGIDDTAHTTASFYYTDGTVGTPTLTATPTGSSMTAPTQGETWNSSCTGVSGVTISPSGSSTKLVGDSLTLTASTTAGSGTLTYVWKKNGIAIPSATSSTYSISSLATGDSGTYTVEVSNGCSTNVASTNNLVLTVNKIDATWTTNANSKTYGDADPNPITTGSGAGFLPADNVTATYSRAAGESVTGGPYHITATLSSTVLTTVQLNAKYNITNAGANFTINLRPATWTTNNSSKTYGDADPIPLTTGSGNFIDAVTATYARAAGESVAGSTYHITATLSAAAGVLANYTITNTGAEFNITTRLATWTTSNNSKTYGDADPIPLTTGSGNFVDAVTATYTRVAGESVAGSTYHITATLSAAAGVLANYTVTNTGAEFNITKRLATWTTNNSSKTYGDADPIPLTTGSGNFVDAVTATYTRAAGESVAGSTYHITATLSAAAGVLDNYTVTNAGAEFNITKRLATWTTSNSGKTYGDADPIPLTTGSGNFVDAVTATYTRAAGESVAGSTYHITATLSAAAGVLANYTITNNGAEFNITKRLAAWTTSNSGKTYGDADPIPLTTGSGNFVDAVTATYTRAAGESVAGSSYHITATLSAAAGVLDNYTITNPGANFNIGLRSATWTTNNNSKTYGNADPIPLTAGGGANFVDGVTASYSRVPGETVGGGPYHITATLSAAPGVLLNYTITNTGANFTINAAKVDVKLEPCGELPNYAWPTPALGCQENTYGEPIYLSAVVTNTGSASAPAGTVTFTIFKDNLGGTPAVVGPAEVNLDGTTPGSSVTPGSGTNQLIVKIPQPATSGLPVGVRLVTALYNAAANFSEGAYSAIQTPGNYLIPVSGTPADISDNTGDVHHSAFIHAVIKQTLDITADNDGKTYGDTKTYGSGSTAFSTGANQLQNGDCVATVTLSSLGAPASASFGNYGISPTAAVACVGTDLNNYDIHYHDGTLSVGKRSATWTTSNNSKTYGDADPIPLTTGSGNFVDAVTATYTRAAGESVAGSTYHITATLSAAPGVLANYTVTNAGAEFNITKRLATWTTDNNSKTYGDADPIPLTTGSGNFVDAVTATYTRAAGESVAGSTYHITATLNAAPGVLDNYTVTNAGAEFNITMRLATWTTSNSGKTYGDADPIPLTTGSGNFVDAVTATYARVSGESVAGSTYHITATLSAAAGVLDNYTITNAGAEFDITKRLATWTTNNSGKTYGDADPIPLTTGSGNFVDAVTASYTRVSGESVAGSTYHITATLSAAPGVLANYTITNTGAEFDITKRLATWTTSNSSKTYGDADPIPLTTGSGNFVDAVTATYTRAAGESVAGSTYHITATLSAAPGVLANYTITNTGAEFDITKRLATWTTSNSSKTYGDADPIPLTTGSGNFVDAVTATYTRAAGESVAGSTYHITATLSAAPGVLANYTITNNGAEFDITKRLATWTTSNSSKTYGDADPIPLTTGSGNFVDAVTATYTRAAGESVAGSTYHITATLSAAPGVLANYTITNNGAEFDITKRLATWTTSNSGKTYGDADPIPLTTGSGNFVDAVTATYTRAAGESVAGSTYHITATLSAAPGVLANYTITNNGAEFDITKRLATWTTSNSGKTYGDADPIPLTTGSGNFVDAVTATYTRAAGESVAGSTYHITATLSAAPGVLANYTITNNGAEFDITKRLATWTTSNSGKTYGDADPIPLTTGSGNFVDAVTATYTRAAGESVAGSTYHITATLSAAPGVLANYTITNNGAEFDITKRLATWTTSNSGKTYGDADPIPLTTGSGNFVDAVTATYTRAAGESVAGSTYHITATLSAGPGVLANYAITNNGAEFDITKRLATWTTSNSGKTYGDADPIPLTTGSGNFVDAVTATYARVSGESVAGSTYHITATLNAAPGVLANYTITNAGAEFDITKRLATWTTSNSGKTYGDADPIPLTTGSGNFVDAVTATYTRAAGESVAGSTYHITATLNAAPGVLANYTITNAGAEFDITKRLATWTTSNSGKTYGDADPIPLTTGSGNFVDAVTATYTRVAGESVAGSTYHITATLSAAAGVLDNYTITNNGAEFNITKRLATWTTSNSSKTYGDADPIPLTTGSGNFVDAVTATYTRVAGESVAGSTYHITATLSAAAGVLDNYTITNNGSNFTIYNAKVTTLLQPCGPYNSGTGCQVNKLGEYIWLSAVVTNNSNTVKPTGSVTFTIFTDGTGITPIGPYFPVTINLADGSTSGGSPLAGTVTAGPGANQWTVLAPQPAVNILPEGVRMVNAVYNPGANFAKDSVNPYDSILTPASYLNQVSYPGGPYGAATDISNANRAAFIHAVIPNTTITLNLSGYSFTDNNGPHSFVVYDCVHNKFSGTLTYTGPNGFSVANKSIVVTIGSQSVTVTTDASGSFTGSLTLNQAPGSVTASASFAGDATPLSPASTSSSVTIQPDTNVVPTKDAGTLYTGSRFFWTTSPTSSTATLTLTATIADVVSCNPDIAKAKVSFFISDDGNTYRAVNSAQNLPVGYVDPNDKSVGTAAAISQYDLGKNQSATLWVKVVVGGWYDYHADTYNVPVTLAKPGQINTLLAGGTLKNDGSSIAGLTGFPASGYLGTAALAGGSSDFAGQVTYTKNLTNPQGQLQITIHSFNKPDGSLDTVPHTYWVKSNAIAELSVKNGMASFSSKTNVYEITGGNKNGLDGGGTMNFTFTPLNGSYQVTTSSGVTKSMTCTNVSGCASIVVFRSNGIGGGVWFSNAWGIAAPGSLPQTIEQKLYNGSTYIQ